MVERSCGMNDGTSSMVVLLEPARSADPPQSSGRLAATALMTLPDATRVATPLGSASKVGSAGGPARGQGAGLQPLEERDVGRRLGRPVAELLVPLGLRRLAAGHGLAGVLEHAGRHLEGLLGVEAQHLLGGGHLVGAQGGAVRLAGVLRVGGRPGDDRAQHDEAGPVGDRLGRADRVVERRHVLAVGAAVVGPVDGLHVPAVRLVAQRDVLGERDVGVVLDRDLVGVVDQRSGCRGAGCRRSRRPRR